MYTCAYIYGPPGHNQVFLEEKMNLNRPGSLSYLRVLTNTSVIGRKLFDDFYKAEHELLKVQSTI